MSHHTWEDYRDTRVYEGDCVLVIKQCLKRVEEDASGLTFQEWTSDVDTLRPHVSMLINSRELRVTGFKLKEVFPPTLEAVARGVMWTRGVGL